jgi:hypothetical protein
MLEMAACRWCVGEVYEQDRVDIFGAGCLLERGAVGVDVEERVSRRKRTKGCLHYWFHIGRVQDDESVDGHRLLAVRVARPRRSIC